MQQVNHRSMYPDDEWENIVMGGRIYDWMFDGMNSGRTREEYPYSFDAYYLWRNFDKANMPENAHTVYADRMRQQDYEKYAEATKGIRGQEWSKQQANKIAKIFWGPHTKCIGMGLACNHSSGYEIGVMIVVHESSK